jgi:hypothetical protein
MDHDFSRDEWDESMAVPEFLVPVKPTYALLGSRSDWVYKTDREWITAGQVEEGPILDVWVIRVEELIPESDVKGWAMILIDFRCFDAKAAEVKEVGEFTSKPLVLFEGDMHAALEELRIANKDYYGSQWGAILIYDMEMGWTAVRM